MKRGLTRIGAILTSIALAITFARGYERYQTLRAVDFDLKRELSGRFGALWYGNAFDFAPRRIWFEKVAVNIGRLVKNEQELTISYVDLNANGMSCYSRGDRYLSEYAGQYDVVDEYWREAVDQVKSAISHRIDMFDNPPNLYNEVGLSNMSITVSIRNTFASVYLYMTAALASWECRST